MASSTALHHGLSCIRVPGPPLQLLIMASTTAITMASFTALQGLIKALTMVSTTALRYKPSVNFTLSESAALGSRHV